MDNPTPAWKAWHPKKTDVHQDWDAIFVGSGLGALMCAARLSKQGKRCLLLDQHYVAGGYAHHFQRKHKGAKYLFDVALHQTGSLRNKDFMYQAFDEIGILDRIEIVPLDTIQRSVFPDLDMTVPADLDAYRAMLKERFPHESDGIDQYIAIVTAIPAELQALTLMQQTGEGDPMELAPNAMRYMSSTLNDLFDDTIQDSLLRALLGQLWGYLGLPPSQLSAIYWAQMWCSYHVSGPCYIRGGGQALSNAMCQTVEEAGGAIVLRAMVDKILVEAGRACGVSVRIGSAETPTEIHAPVIVSNASTIATFNTLIEREHVPDELFEQVNTMPISTSIIQAYIGIDGDAAELGLSEHEFFLNTDVDYDAEWDAIQDGQYENVSIMASNHSSVNKDACPPGKSIVQAALLASGDHWLGLPDAEYQAKKAHLTETILDRLSELIPDIRERIEVIEVGTPKTMYDYSLNPKGAVYGYAVGATTHSVFRPQQSTGIPGLYLASAWTFPGPGFGGAMTSGYFAAEAILSETAAAAV